MHAGPDGGNVGGAASQPWEDTMRRQILRFVLVFGAVTSAAQSQLTARPLTLVRESRIDGVEQETFAMGSKTQVWMTSVDVDGIQSVVRYRIGQR